MRKMRTLAVGALLVPMALGASGIAMAAPGDNEQGQGLGQLAGLGQTGTLGQGNASVDPITQVNPAVNLSDVTGFGSFFDEGDTTQSIKQDNSVDSETEQGNLGGVAQDQRSDQSGELGQGLLSSVDFAR